MDQTRSLKTRYTISQKRQAQRRRRAAAQIGARKSSTEGRKRNFKKGGDLLRQEPEVKRFLFIREQRHKFRVAKLCEVLAVSRSGYYAWEKRPKSARKIADERLTEEMKLLHEKSAEPVVAEK